MKKMIILALLETILLADSTRVQRINKTLIALQSQLQHQSDQTIKVTYDPFHPQHKVVSKKVKKAIRHHHKKNHTKPYVSMILNNKAFINGKWYSKNQKVARYVLTRIDEDSITLTRNGKHLTLFVNQPKHILVTKEAHK